MMIKNYQKRSREFLRRWEGFFLLAGVISLLTLGMRIYRLASFPIFADEAIYIRWAQVMRSEPTLRFLPLSDGKQPLFMWLLIPFLKFFADPLFAGRFLSVLSGIIFLWGLVLTVLFLFGDRRQALLTGLIFAFLPYFFFCDRMAMVDSLLAALGIWIFLLAVLLARKLRTDVAMVLGGVLGAAFITKSPAMFLAILIPTTVVFLPVKDKGEERIVAVLKLVGLWFISYVIALLIYNLLRLGPGFEMIAARNKDYVFGWQEVLKHPLDPLLPHFRDIAGWFSNLFTWPILLLVILGIIVFFRKKEANAPSRKPPTFSRGVEAKPKRFTFSLRRHENSYNKKLRTISPQSFHKLQGLVILLWLVLPLLAQSAVAKVFTPRYLLFTLFPLIIFSGLGLLKIIERISLNWAKVLFLVLIFSLALRYDWLIATKEQDAPFPRNLRSGHLEEWCSGYGIVQVRDYLNNLLKTENKIIVGTEGYFGTLPDGLFIYFDKERRVEIVGVGQPVFGVPGFLRENSPKYPCFLVVNKSRMKAVGPDLHLVFEVPKASWQGNQDYLQFFQIK